MESKPISKTRKISAWILVGLLSALILFSSAAKFMAIDNPNAEMYKNFIKWGLAIATHMEHAEMYMPIAILLVLIWLANYLRNPEMLQSFTKK